MGAWIALLIPFVLSPSPRSFIYPASSSLSPQSWGYRRIQGQRRDCESPPRNIFKTLRVSSPAHPETISLVPSPPHRGGYPDSVRRRRDHEPPPTQCKKIIRVSPPAHPETIVWQGTAQLERNAEEGSGLQCGAGSLLWYCVECGEASERGHREGGPPPQRGAMGRAGFKRVSFSQVPQRKFHMVTTEHAGEYTVIHLKAAGSGSTER